MLKSLKINNIAVIENAEPVFSDGLNVMTGETGAGKSIIVDSINAILGERTSKGIIRTGCEKATVVAVFEDVSDESRELFLKHEIEDDDGMYIFQRSLSSSGKSGCKINGFPVNTSVFKEIGANLINIHGQHDNQKLLDSDNHCIYLDAYANCKALLDDYKESFERFKETRRELNKSIQFEEEKQDRIEILKYQIDELQNAEIIPGEVSSLKDKLQIIENSEKISNSLSSILAGFSDTDNSILDSLNEYRSVLAKTTEIFKPISSAFDKLTEVIFELEGFKSDVESAISQVDFNKEELNSIQNRLDKLYELMRKYGGSEEKALKFLEAAQKEIDSITLNSENRIKLENQLLGLQEELISKAATLSVERKKAALRLSEEICNILKFLDMEDVAFEVDISQGSYTSVGTDRVEFFISTNKGQKLMPLSKVASGGELSRIMLAIKSVLADKDGVDTLIFDEIDTGISGRAARKIGIQLKRVSKLRQVICITHLAQIAAIADNHMLIKKSSTHDKTYTSVTALSGDERIAEVARIMSGTDITENLYKTAKELIDSELA